MSTPATVVIIGGGVAGALAAIQLSRSTTSPDVVLIDRNGTFARGVAYATTSAGSHLLNVPVARMSLFADDPEHFLRWARARLAAPLPADTFLPRSLFGDYVAEVLVDASVRDRRRIIRCVRAAAIDVEPGIRTSVHCDDGARIGADHVVIALGNGAPAPPPLAPGTAFQESPRYVGNPWATDALGRIASDEAVLLVGSGLTMYDVVLALRERGHAGTIHVVSRRGLLPRAHAAAPLAPGSGPSPEHWLSVPSTVPALVRAVRAACEESHDWRAVIDSLRSVSGRLWQRLDVRDRARFLARVRPFWDVHRHRAPVVVYGRIHGLIADGTVRGHVGSIRAWEEDATGVTACLGRDTVRVARVVNCTGPDTDVRRSADPLVRALLARGLIVRDPLGLGVETTEDGALIDVAGRVSTSFSTLGTWRRAERWESVAVPEIRAQAAALARRLTDDGSCRRTLTSSPASSGSEARTSAPALRYGREPEGELRSW